MIKYNSLFCILLMMLLASLVESLRIYMDDNFEIPDEVPSMMISQDASVNEQEFGYYGNYGDYGGYGYGTYDF